MASFELTPAHGWAFIVIAVISMEIIMISFMAMGARAKLFGKDSAFRKSEAFAEICREHAKATKEKEVNAIGYPDSGDGWYSRYASYGDWYKYALWRRAHRNFVDMGVGVLAMLMLNTLLAPQTSIVLGSLYAIGRALYAYGYVKGGPSSRARGAMIGALAFFAIFCSLVFESLRLTGVLAPLGL